MLLMGRVHKKQSEVVLLPMTMLQDSPSLEVLMSCTVYLSVWDLQEA